MLEEGSDLPYVPCSYPGDLMCDYSATPDALTFRSNMTGWPSACFVVGSKICEQLVLLSYN